MASTSSSSQQNHTMFEVFLSFRGEDTRDNFTDHLFHALKRAGLRTFRDDDEIGRGEELKPEIERAVIQSKSSIIVLSKNYANSRWCLDELWLILEQRRKNKHFVLPLFYHVDPSDVRNQRGSYAIEVKEGIEGSKWSKGNVIRWKAALAEVASLKGMTYVSGSEMNFIVKVVNTVNYKLDLKLPSTPTHLTGIETRSQFINSWLDNEQSGTNFLAICGMGGAGKTTLAHYVYNSNKQNFEGSSLIEEIGNNSKETTSLIKLQKQLLQDVLRRKNVKISSVSEGTRKIQDVLEMKRVLIVLDDIDEYERLDALLGGKTFHPQSKIIITTRLLDIDSWFGRTYWRCLVYKLKLLNQLESLELFCWHAFGSQFPIADFEKLTIQLAGYCQGNPLALKVLGSSLRIGAENPSNLLDLWKSRLKSLNSSKGDIHYKIQAVLQRSFASLPYDNDKELFLHIACFFVDVNKEDVATVFEDDLQAKSGMMTLINRCLVTISSDGTLQMHQLLQEMGRRIVCDESKYPAERSRIWCGDEAYNLLRKGYGSKKIEGLSIIPWKTKQPLAAIEASSLVKLNNLKLLQILGVDVVGPYTNFPDLICFCWFGCNLKTIPSGLLTSRLVGLDLCFGDLEEFEPPTVLHSLKILKLGYCHKLVSICNFFRLPKLESLLLDWCSSLAHVCEGIGEVKSLKTLELTGCTKLFKASLNKKYANRKEGLKALKICGGIQEQPLLPLPQSLKLLHLNFCNLEYNHDFHMAFHAKSFFCMNLRANLFQYLPDNIDLKVFCVLDLSSCSNLKSLPNLPSTLQELYVDWCTSLERIAFQSARFSLHKFRYEGCFKLSEIQGLFKLMPVERINKTYLGDMGWIKTYQDHMVELVGDLITKGRSWQIQMLYEYGIRSTYLQGIKDQSIVPYEYTSSTAFLYFHVPPLHRKRIQGLNVRFRYRSAGLDKDMWIIFATIRNRTKGLTWAYNPVVYGKPKVDEDVVWLSYWPIGNMLHEGDEVRVGILWEEGLIISGCGVSLVYIDGEVGGEETCENYTPDEEVIRDGHWRLLSLPS